MSDYWARQGQFDHTLADKSPDSYNGYASAAVTRTPLYGGLGTVVSKDVSKDTNAMLEAAGLNWGVSLVPVNLSARSDKLYNEVVRDGYGPNGDETFSMGIVGNIYKELQNKQLFDFASGLVHGDGYWDMAGQFNYGRTVFGVLKFDRSIYLDPNGANDEVEDSIIVSTSHNGSTAIVAANTAMRLDCMNALTISIKGAKRVYKIRHTTTLEGKLTVAREALNLNRLYMDKFSEEANAMIAMELAPSAPEKIFRKLNPEPEGNTRGAHTKWENKWEQFQTILAGPTLSRFDGTNAWKVLNALTEQMDWFKSPRKGNTERVLASGSGFIEADNKLKDRMRDVVFAYGKANGKIRVAV
jgi:phage/plasmid-like protein (TIGR03299 family)